MKTVTKILSAVAAAGLAAWVVQAQDAGNQPPAGERPGQRQGGPNGGQGGPGRDGQRPPAPPIVRALDLNGDGVIDAEEIAKASESLKTLDKNGDGKLTPDEFMGMPPRRGGGPGGPGGFGPQGGQGGQNGDGNRPSRPPGE